MTSRLYWARGQIIRLKRKYKPHFGKNPKNWPDEAREELNKLKQVAENEQQRAA